MVEELADDDEELDVLEAEELDVLVELEVVDEDEELDEVDVVGQNSLYGPSVHEHWPALHVPCSKQVVRWYGSPQSSRHCVITG